MLRAYAVFAAVIAIVLAAGQTGASDASAGGPTGGRGTFSAECMLSHRANDDPIVFRRGPGKSHMHDFMGGKTTAFSTGKTLQQGGTTCLRGNSTGGRKTADKSGYWVPTLYENGRPVFPGYPGASIYYFSGTRDYSAIRPFPAGLRVIAGSSKGRSTTKSPVAQVVRWNCRGPRIAPPLGPGQAPICAKELALEIRFPDCWDGSRLDSKDHISHMAYSHQARSGDNRRVCPRTHPVLVPMLVLQVRYPTKGGPGVKLASGDLRTAHADFMNGWNQKELTRLVRACLNTDRYCGGDDGPVPGHA